MTKTKFGVFLSAEKPNFNSLLDEVLHCENLGYHSVWISDHLIGMYINPGDPRLECWTTMSAIASRTSTIRLGQLVMCNLFRHPSLVAKSAATLDSISGGRLILGLGTGWHEGELKAYGYPLESAATRVRKLDEAAQIIKKMWTEEAPSFNGKYFQIEEAYCSPKPIQRPHPPLLLAGSGEKLTLKTVAKYADISNFAAWMGTPIDFHHKTEILKEHCRRVGRSFDSIQLSWAGYTLISKNSSEAEMNFGRYTKNMEARYGVEAAGRIPPLHGTPEQMITQLQGYINEGVSLFIIRFMGENLKEEARLFAEEVTPSF
jgi:F420-dependent oxidoreductase-like protein